MASWCLVFQVYAQPNIVKAEYYIDTDPGFGNATAISVTPAANITNNTFIVPSGSLSKGIHTLFIRSRDASGKWSVTNSHVFYLFGLPVNIVKAEYYIDTDPGIGNATSITITPSTNIVNNTFNISVNLINQGVHTLLSGALMQTVIGVLQIPMYFTTLIPPLLTKLNITSIPIRALVMPPISRLPHLLISLPLHLQFR